MSVSIGGFLYSCAPLYGQQFHRYAICFARARVFCFSVSVVSYFHIVADIKRETLKNHFWASERKNYKEHSMTDSDSSGVEDYDEERYPQMNADLSMPGVKKKMYNVLVTGFGPFDVHNVNASWEAVKELSKLGIAHNINLITQEIPVEYTTVQRIVPELWAKYQPELVVHVGVSGIASEITFETMAHNHGYKRPDVAEKSAPSQCYNVHKGDDCLKTNFAIDKLCEDVNESGCLAMAVPSSNAGRYLCEYIYYASLCHDQSRVVFIHVPPLDEPYSASELGHALKCSIQCLLKQLDLYHPLSLPDAEVMEKTAQQHLLATGEGR